MTTNFVWSEVRKDYRLSALATVLGDLLVRRGSSALTAATLAVLIERRRLGHSCVAVQGLAAKVVDLGPLDPSREPPPRWPAFPSYSEMVEHLAADAAVADGKQPSVLVLDAAGRFYLYRDYCSEQGIVQAVRARLCAPSQQDDRATLLPLLQSLFSDVQVEHLFADPTGSASDTSLDQPRAVLASHRSQFLVITGGPGTGKTTTVVRLLAFLLTLQPDLNIALAAPTGKAAARLSQAIVTARNTLPVDATIRNALTIEVRTLHRLLQATPAEPRFRYHKDNPLPLDLVIVDEASMVDLTMMAALFDALPTTTKVILVGDQDQLASVEAGDVLGDLCRLATDAEAVAAVPALQDSVVRLRHNWRFKDQPGLTRLAEAVRLGDADLALQLLDSEPGLCLLEPTNEDDAVKTLEDWFTMLLVATDPAASLLALDQARILCAHRRGPFSMTTLEAAVQRMLLARGIDAYDPLHDHRPIMITKNDPGTGLYNGDVGVLRIQDQALRAYFRDSRSGALRPALTPARLPEHQSAFALTVHKSQGSEYDRVLLVLPKTDSPILTRELLYTGLTRARHQVTIVASQEILRSTIERVTARPSGIRDSFVR